MVSYLAFKFNIYEVSLYIIIKISIVIWVIRMLEFEDVMYVDSVVYSEFLYLS